jgi:hypothetical protein
MKKETRITKTREQLQMSILKHGHRHSKTIQLLIKLNNIKK